MAAAIGIGLCCRVVVARSALVLCFVLAPAAMAGFGCGAKSGEVGRTWHDDRARSAADASDHYELDAGVDRADDDDELTEPAFADPGCPDVEEPPDSILCDPLIGKNECGEGYACSPYVDYPTQPCEAERFGTECAVAGPGVQGDSCVEQQCAAGFLCVASGQGTVCAQLCVSPGPNTCPVGLLCGTVDLKGYGVCF